MNGEFSYKGEEDRLLTWLPSHLCYLSRKADQSKSHEQNQVQCAVFIYGHIVS
jgi:hypothetical protein